MMVPQPTAAGVYSGTVIDSSPTCQSNDVMVHERACILEQLVGPRGHIPPVKCTCVAAGRVLPNRTMTIHTQSFKVSTGLVSRTAPRWTKAWAGRGDGKVLRGLEETPNPVMVLQHISSLHLRLRPHVSHDDLLPVIAKSSSNSPHNENVRVKTRGKHSIL
ncbi:hypothetical protein Bbelb_233160 [Branchiostoma belcheri]|nr:hypothetical protein Bbelb_233160 [Branchiostoma belcheri]